MTGGLGSYQIKIDKTKAANNLKIELYAKTMGRVEIKQDVEYVVCPTTGGSKVTIPPSTSPWGTRAVEATGRKGGDSFILPDGAYFKQIHYQASGSSANLNFTQWAIEDIYPQCGQFYRYDVELPSNVTSKITYPEPGYSRSYCDYTIGRCRNVRVSYTHSVGIYMFYLHLYPIHDQTSFRVPYYVDITPCSNSASLSVSSHPANVVLDKQPETVQVGHYTDLEFNPEYYNRFSNSQGTNCPVIRLDLYVDHHTYSRESSIGYNHYDINHSYRSAQDCKDYCDDTPSCVGVVHSYWNDCWLKSNLHSSYRFGAWHRTSYTKQKEAVWSNSALVLHDADRPQMGAAIRVYDTSAVTLPPVRIYGYTMNDYNAYMRLSVQVCGEETLTLTTPAKKLIVLGEEVGEPSSMSESQRYYTISESTFSTYFQSSSSTCTIKWYEIRVQQSANAGSNLAAEMGIAQTSSLVTLTGTLGNIQMKVDKTAATGSEIIYLKAITKGLIEVEQEFEF
jgi:hypothetical protein